MKELLPTNTDIDLQIIWGATGIAKAIGRSERVVYELLEKGRLTGAKKVGGSWCITANKLREFFEKEDA